jgi:hypothetical protein
MRNLRSITCIIAVMMLAIAPTDGASAVRDDEVIVTSPPLYSVDDEVLLKIPLDHDAVRITCDSTRVEMVHNTYLHLMFNFLQFKSIGPDTTTTLLQVEVETPGMWDPDTLTFWTALNGTKATVTFYPPDAEPYSRTFDLRQQVNRAIAEFMGDVFPDHWEKIVPLQETGSCPSR